MSSYDDDYDEPKVYIDATLNLTTPDLNLDTKVSSNYSGTSTLAELICRQALDKLAKGPAWDDLAKRVREITTEEIRAHVTALIKDAMTGDLRRTNTYGEPYGEPTTLRTLIAEEAKTALTRPSDRSSRTTVLQELVRNEVVAAMRAELSTAIADERAKVVAAVRTQAAQLIAEAVTAGVGQKP
ncbi:hypothetical protein [Streptosporangium sp. NPDC049078]|uniref:hypothetical protein n=1 Tax=Streptosporangium sp. NPDC049078 TaxID=3155767 RepID=UPI003432079F